jgi:hypothetical protein
MAGRYSTRRAEALARQQHCWPEVSSSDLSADSLRQAHIVFAATAADAQQQMPSNCQGFHKPFVLQTAAGYGKHTLDLKPAAATWQQQQQFVNSNKTFQQASTHCTDHNTAVATPVPSLQSLRTVPTCLSQSCHKQLTKFSEAHKLGELLGELHGTLSSRTFRRWLPVHCITVDSF